MFDKFICLLARIDCKKINPIDYDKLLRYPGQSLDEKIQDISYDYITRLVFVSAIISVLIFILSPWVILLNLIVIFALTAKFIRTIHPIKLGRDGEKAMAQYLHSIARETSDIYNYHDIVNHDKSYNIDHVVVSKKGIFIFDTKTYSKQKGMENIIKSDGSQLFKNGKKITSNLPLQIKGQAKWLESELRKKLGVDYEIKRTIAFIGWYVSGDKVDGTYISTAKNIKSVLENQYLEEKFDSAELIRINTVLRELAGQSSKIKDICCL